MIRKFWPLLFFVLVLTFPALAQNQQPPLKPPDRRSSDRNEDQEISHLPEDMRVKMAIARAEEDHKKILEDVEKLTTLSGEVSKGFEARKQLSSDDIRKLGTIEKLAKRVLNQSGGEEVDQKSEELERMPLAQAIDLLNATAEKIKKQMTAETRFVVSATVIAESNEMIGLTRAIRRAKKTD
jgi:hypothetical protein